MNHAEDCIAWMQEVDVVERAVAALDAILAPEKRSAYLDKLNAGRARLDNFYMRRNLVKAFEQHDLEGFVEDELPKIGKELRGAIRHAIKLPQDKSKLSTEDREICDLVKEANSIADPFRRLYALVYAYRVFAPPQAARAHSAHVVYQSVDEVANAVSANSFSDDELAKDNQRRARATSAGDAESAQL